jgi:hypothetical protein
MVRPNTNAAPKLLNSWKEIAAYLDRGVRTVQRWEHEFRLPVHRIGKGKRSPVYAVLAELNFWIATTGVLRPTQPTLQIVKPSAEPTPAQDPRRLLTNIQTLARNLAEASVRQQRQAELLQKRIFEIRSRLK